MIKANDSLPLLRQVYGFSTFLGTLGNDRDKQLSNLVGLSVVSGLSASELLSFDIELMRQALNDSIPIYIYHRQHLSEVFSELKATPIRVDKVKLLSRQLRFRSRAERGYSWGLLELADKVRSNKLLVNSWRDNGELIKSKHPVTTDCLDRLVAEKWREFDARQAVSMGTKLTAFNQVRKVRAIAKAYSGASDRDVAYFMGMRSPDLVNGWLESIGVRRGAQ